MESVIPEISQLLNNTISPDKTLVSASADRLDRLSSQAGFLPSLLAIATVGDSQGLKIAAAIYLKNFVRRHELEIRASSGQYIEFRNQLTQTLLQADSSVLKVLVEAFQVIITSDFVKENTWPGLIPELRAVIQSSKLISQSPCAQWNTFNALIVLQTTIRPFQYFLNPKIPKEPVPSQLELIVEGIIVPLQATFRFFVDKALSCPDRLEKETEEVLLIICKCIYFSVRSYMPSALRLVLPSFCDDWFRILDSLSLGSAFSGDGHLLRLKIMKRILNIFCALVTRHRKHSDKLMPNIIKCAIKIVQQNANISMLDALPERIVSLAFDVMTHVLETGPGWRLISPHFSSVLDSAIFPVLALNQKDALEWEEDADEYIRKNLPSNLDDISGLTEDLFTARKSAINLLGVIAMSKGPVVSTASKHKKRDRNKKKECHSTVGELLVVPFLSKFPIPCGGEESSSTILKDYYGVLMAYGGLQDFFKGRSSEYIYSLLQNRVLPIFFLCPCSPYLLSTANWLLGELACCLPKAVSANIYNSLTKALTWSDDGDFNYYPVRASAAGAITELLNNEYFPPDWTPLLQVLVNRMGIGDENESLIFFNLLSTVVEAGQDKVAVHIPVVVSNIVSVMLRNMPPSPEPWSQVVEHGFAALAEVARIWESSLPDNIQHPDRGEWRSGWASIATLFSNLLQKAWVMPVIKNVDDNKLAVSGILPPSSCIDDASTLLGFIMRFITERDEVTSLKLVDLLALWSTLIADWDLWEEMEDQAIFISIREAVNLQRKCNVQILFFTSRVPLANSSPASMLSIFESICIFVSEAINAYPSAVWRACSCILALLHVPSFSADAESIKHTMAITFARAAFSRFRDIHGKPTGLWKPLLLVISSCYIFYPKDIERVLEKEADKGFIIWASSLAQISTSSSTPGLSTESELLLSVVTLTKLVERLLISLLDRGEVLRLGFMALLDAFTRLKEFQEGNEDAEDSDEEETEDDDDNDDDSDEDSEDDQLEETEDEFLDRYAKAAADLENEMVEEGDIEDDALELELGVFDEIKLESSLLQLIESHGRELMKGRTFPPTVLQGLINCFPEHTHLFQFP